LFSNLVQANINTGKLKGNPDPILLHGCLKRDRKSQEILYREYYGYGMSICLRYAANRNEAVEILNEGFMKVFLNLNHFDPGQPFLGWFRKILINTAINNYHQQQKGKRLVDLDSSPVLTENGSNGLDQLSFQEMIAMVQTLSPVYRAVFNLYVIEGYNHKEIGKMLKISEGTSKSNLSRARAYLRNLLIKSNEKGLEKLER
jgi:RNA polymerase sigma factor (sigma-70 family)